MRVTRVELDTRNREEWKITVSDEWQRRDPKVDTLPEHIQVALLKWLGARS